MATRTPLSRLGGNGPAFDKGLQGVGDRANLEIRTNRVYFLEGKVAPGGPYFTPAMRERYELVDAGQRPPVSDPDIPVRLDVAQPSEEIVELRYQRIQKEAYGQFIDATQANIWPWEEKLGARPIGQWKVIYPKGFGLDLNQFMQFLTVENPDYDEIVTMTRYASIAHYDAMAPDKSVYLGGNGPDWQAWRSAYEGQRKLIISTTVEIIQGFLYNSPPVYLPGLPERYRRVD
jgi:hypothetical protein